MIDKTCCLFFKAISNFVWWEMFLYTSYWSGGHFWLFLISNIFFNPRFLQICLHWWNFRLPSVLSFFIYIFSIGVFLKEGLGESLFNKLRLPFILFFYIAFYFKELLVITCTSVSPFPFCDYNITQIFSNFNIRFVQS